jgi:hypothetical protein
MDVICGGALLIVNCSTFDPTELGFTAATEARPATAIRDAEIVAVTCWLLTNVAGTGCPFQSTAVDEAKFDPLTVSVNAFPPAMTLDGDNELSTAGGGGGGGEIDLLSLPHPAKATARLKSTTAASAVFCLICCMIASV